MVELSVRLAIRREGEFVNAYHAGTDSMQGAMLMGSIRVSILDKHPEVWNDWKQLMTRAYQALIEGALGQKPEMTESPAPEHERSGRA